MRKMTLSEADGSGFRPRCFAALAGYKGPLFNERDNLPHPLGTLGHSWRQVLAAYSRCLNALEAKERAKLEISGDEAIDELLSAFRDILYRSTEYIEDITKNVAGSLSANPKKPLRINGARKLRDLVALPCNRLKHDHNRIHYVEATPVGFSVPGYAIYHVKAGALVPNIELHSGRRAASFNTELRKILAILYLYSEEVAQSITNIGPSTPPPESPDSQTVQILERVSRLPVFVLPWESGQHMPSILFDGKTLSISDEGGIAFPARRDTQLLAHYVGDGCTKSFSVP